MLSRFGIEASQAAQYVIAFVIILVLVALFGLVLRRLTGGRLMLPGQDRGRARQPRLGIVDIYDLDRQRQLILLRRDNVEHLLLIGGPNDVVIETNIVRVAGARLPTAGEPSLERPDSGLERAPEFPSRPQVENGRPSLEAQIAARLNDLVARPSEQSDVDQELSAAGTATASAPLRVEPPLKPDSVSGPAGPAGPGVAPVPGPGAGFRPSRTEPVMPEPPRPAASEPPQVRPEPRPAPSLRPVPPPRPVTTPEPVRPAPARPTPPAPQPPAPPPAGEGRAPEAAILSDMAKQLEQALRRPGQAGEQAAGERDQRPAASSGPQPTPAPAAAPQGPARPPEPPRPAVEPVRPVPLRPEAAHMPVEPSRPEPVRPETVRPEPARPETARPEPVRPEQGRREPMRAEPPRPEPVRPEPARPEPARPEPVRPEPPRQETARPEPARPETVRAEPPRPAPAATPAAAEPPAAPKRTVDDPFSVEEIEAEFARLLGRPVDKSDRS